MTVVGRHPIPLKPGRGDKFPRKVVEIDGHVFASQREAKRYGELKQLARARKIKGLLIHPVYHAYIKDQALCRYTADFAYVDCDTDEHVVEDVKSSGTRKDDYYRLRKKAVELYHGIKVVEVVQ